MKKWIWSVAVVALVALTPLIAIQIMGLVYRVKADKRLKQAVAYAGIADDSDRIVDLEEVVSYGE